MQAAATFGGFGDEVAGRGAAAGRQPLTLSGWVLVAARVAFVAFALLALEQLVFTYHSLDRSYLTEDTPSWPRHEQIVKGLAQLHVSRSLPAWWYLGLTYAEAVVSFGLAAVLFWRRSNQPIALLVGVFLMGSTVGTYPGDLHDLAKAHPWEAFFGAVATYPFPAGLVMLAFVFPDGRFVPRWTAVPVGLTLAGLAVTFFPYPRDVTIGGPLADAVQLVALLGMAIGSQAYRYRRVANSAERSQLRLFIVGFGFLLAMFVVFNVAIDLGNLDRPDFPPVWAVLFSMGIGTVFSLASLLLAGLLAASILRYRLFDIEIVLNRTLVLAGLTAAVALIYVAVVGGAQFAFSGAANGVIAVVAAAIVALAFQPLRLRLQRGANRLLYGARDEPYTVLTGLGRRLETAITSSTVLEEIVGAVTGALKLPYAAIRLVDSDGPVVESGKAAPIALRLPLSHGGEALGELEVAQWPGTSLTERDRVLLEDLARHSGAAISAARLTQDLLRSRERLVNALEEERRRMRRDLHDGLGPRLASMVLRLDTVRDAVEPGTAAERMLVDLGEGMSEAIVDIRRLVYGLRPPALDDLGLVGALRQSFAGAPGDVPFVIDAPEEMPPLPAAVEVAAFRIAQEAMTNVVRHAGATACEVRLAREDAGLVLTVADNGRGLGGGVVAGVGLRSMRERAEELGGSLTVSPRDGGGTIVRAVLPFAVEAGAR